MSRIWTYVTGAIQGLERYLLENKLAVVLFAFLLACLFAEKKAVGEKGSKMLVYTLVLCVLLLCPITAAVIMMYQTAYYDYEWAWSLVPVTAVIAYGATLLVERGFQKSKKLLGILAVTGVLCLCGNQGAVLTVDSREANAAVNTKEVLQAAYDAGMSGQHIVWAPKDLMQEVRRQDGKILLIYGRDMWDEKAGAYDYEAYDASLTEAYIWLEAVTVQADLAATLADPAKSFAILCEERELNEEREKHLRTVLDTGANTIVLPNLVAEHIQESILAVAEEKQLSVKHAYTEEYTIYLFE